MTSIPKSTLTSTAVIFPSLNLSGWLCRPRRISSQTCACSHRRPPFFYFPNPLFICLRALWNIFCSFFTLSVCMSLQMVFSLVMGITTPPHSCFKVVEKKSKLLEAVKTTPDVWKFPLFFFFFHFLIVSRREKMPKKGEN